MLGEIKSFFFKFIEKYFKRKNYLIQKYSSKEKIVEFYKLIKPVPIKEGLIRVGSSHDGGYLIPNLLDNIDYNFSPGVSDNFDFEKQLYKEYNIKSFLADYSIENTFSDYEYINFIKKYIGNLDSENYTTLSSWVSNSLTQDSTIMLSMDIENDEWNVLLNESGEFFRKFKIIIIEFHNFANYLINKDSFMFVESTFKKIQKNFEVVHIHPNNCCGEIIYDNLRIPNVVEFSFLNKENVNLSDQEIQLPHKLDSKNIKEHSNLLLQEIWNIS